jgi:hypothetical protein
LYFDSPRYFNTTVTSLILVFTIYLIFYAITLCCIMFIRYDNVTLIPLVLQLGSKSGLRVTLSHLYVYILIPYCLFNGWPSVQVRVIKLIISPWFTTPNKTSAEPFKCSAFVSVCCQLYCSWRRHQGTMLKKTFYLVEIFT